MQQAWFRRKRSGWLAAALVLAAALLAGRATRADSVSAAGASPVNEAFVQQLLGSGESYARYFGADGARPAGLAQGGQPLNQVDQIVLPELDVAAQLAEDDRRLANGEPRRFAYPYAVDLNLATRGTWEQLPNGLWLWRLRIAAPQARSLNLGFTRYFMPKGGRLFVYRPDQSVIVGAFTERDNEVHGQLWTPVVDGAEVVIEVTVPAAERAAVQLQLSAINYGYRAVEQPDSGACNVDVVCPQGDGWRQEIRSVAVYTVSGVWTCTGAMINNTAQDLRPFFLTANHCGVGVSDAPAVVVYWNFENSVCRVPGSAESGGAGDGSLAQFMTGSIFRAAYTASDVSLIEFDDPVPTAFKVFWAGWDRSGVDATSAVAIHHPNTDEKRISFENAATQVTSYMGTTVPGDGTHVRVVDWDLGTTEPGSSGSPLFNQNHRIIGQLHGGDAACGNDSSDYYGRLFVSWTGGGSSATRLSNWLDPLNSGVLALDGREQASFDFSLTPATQTICAPAAAVYTVSVTSMTSATVPVTLSVLGAPLSTTVAVAPNPVTPPGNGVLTVSNTSAATPGAYTLSVVGTAVTETVTKTASLFVATATPGAALLISPTNGYNNAPPRPIFGWNAVAQATEYQLEVASDAAFSTIIYTATTASTSHTLNQDLTLATTYYWRVRARNGCGSTLSAVWHFTTQTGPGACPIGYTANTVFSEGFEAGAGGWTHTGTGDTWALSTARKHSGTNSFMASDPATVSDQQLASPAITIPVGQSPVTLQFWNYQSLEDRSGGCYDGVVLEISTTNGASWTQVTTGLLTDPYDGLVSTSFSNPLGGKNAWCGDPQDWLNSIVDLDAYTGQAVRFRFRLGSDSSSAREGWYIDDVAVKSCLPSSTADLQIHKTDDVDAVAPGQQLHYTIVVTNNAAAPITNARVVDIFPAGLGQLDWTCAAPNGSCGAAGGSGHISTTVSLAAHDHATLVATATVAMSMTDWLTNTAYVFAPEGLIDDSPEDNVWADTDAIGGVIYLPLLLK